MSIYDCFMYFDEDVMLDLRLHTLGEYIDTFVIAEATRDHAGKEKRLNFDQKVHQYLGIIIFHYLG